MLESFPYIPLFAQVRLAVAIFSYDGALSFGVSGDYDSSADIDVLCRGIESGMAELVAAASLAGPGSRAASAASASAAAAPPKAEQSTKA
jgi:hypothetical protein